MNSISQVPLHTEVAHLAGIACFAERGSFVPAALSLTGLAWARALLAEVARSILALEFPEGNKQRMHELAAKARDGTLTQEEQAEIESYERAGHILNIMASVARRSLKTRSGARKQRK